MTQVRTAYLYSGLPGAGKSVASDFGQEFVGGTKIESGNIVREMAADEGVENASSEELAEFAARQREELGESFFADKLTNWMLQGKMNPSYPLHLSGVRHISSVRRFREFFELVPLLRIVAPQEIRLRRLNRRGREGEGDWDMANLAQRDEIEMESLGQGTILDNPDEITHVVENVGTLDDLRAEIADITDVVQEQEEKLKSHYD